MTTLDTQPSTTFYITGGTLPPNASSYVTRQADDDLYTALRNGEYCYVLNSRQMGKSSLCVRTTERLKQEGYRIAFLDLTRFGGKNLTPEQWYAGMLSEIGRAFDLRNEFLTYWKSHAELSPLQRLFGAVQEVGLPANAAPHVIFIDEIDVTRSLPFSTDEFFAAIRQLYVGRATDPALKRLGFCLLGTATPAELIQDTRVSPFNIGKRIDLRDFTAQEAAPLAQGLAGGKPVLDRVLYWTGGHPYLTQRLCRALAEALALPATQDMTSASVSSSLFPLPSSLALVDRLCTELFLTHRAREADDNLAFVRNRLLKSEVDPASLLELYGKMRAGKRVPDDETNPLCSVVKLSGVARVEDGLLRVRNRIYAYVFDRAWVVTHLPDADLRRQRQAFRRGLALAGALSGVVLAIIGVLAGVAIRNAQRASLNENHARESAKQAKQETATAKAATARADASAKLAVKEKLRADAKAHLAGVKSLEAASNLALANVRMGQANVARLREASAHKEAILRAGEAAKQRDEAEHLFYIADMNLILPSYEQNAFGQIRHLLDETRTSKFRGFEWDYWNRMTHLELFSTKLQAEIVGAVALSPDGKHIATGSEDTTHYTAKIWDLVTGREVMTLRGHNNLVTCVAYSRDGKHVVTGSRDNTARVWNAATGLAEHTFTNKSGVDSVAFSPDGKWIFTGCDDTAIIWDLATNHEHLTLPAAVVLAGAFSPDGGRIVTVAGGTDVQVWNTSTGSQALSLVRPEPGVSSCVAFSPDGKHIVTGSIDNTAHVWNAASGQMEHTLSGHANSIMSVAFSPDSMHIVTGSTDNTAKVWDATTGREERTLKGHSFWVFAAAYTQDGRNLITASVDKTVKVWDALNSHEALTLTGQTLAVPIRSVAFSYDSKRIVIGSQDNTAVVSSASTGRKSLVLTGHEMPVTSVAFSPDGKRIVTGSEDRTARVWDATTGREALLLKGHSARVTAVAFSPDSTRIVTGSEDRTARVWDAISGRAVYTLTGHKNAVTSVAFSPDGKRIVTGSQDNSAKIWDARNGRFIFTLAVPNQAVMSVAFSPDGNRIFTGCAGQNLNEGNSAKIWNAATGREVITFNTNSAVTSAAYSPDGKRIVTASFMGHGAIVWDTTTGRETLTILGQSGGISSVAFSPDGKRIVSGSFDGTAKVWDSVAWTDTRQGKPSSEELLAAIVAKDTGKVKELLEKGADPNAKLYSSNDLENGYDTPLGTATLLGDIPTMQALIAKGADINLPNGQGILPLMRAVLMKQPDVANWLLDHKADAKALGPAHRTVLHFAVQSPVNLDLCQRLLSSGSDVNARSDGGSTPLMFAATYNCPETMKLLLDHHADVTLKDAKGKTALARAKGAECQQLLKQAGAKE